MKAAKRSPAVRVPGDAIPEIRELYRKEPERKRRLGLEAQLVNMTRKLDWDDFSQVVIAAERLAMAKIKQGLKADRAVNGPQGGSTEIRTEERHWATVHIGGRDELIAVGHAKPEEFPGQPGCGKTSTIFRKPDGSKWKKVSRRSTYWWEVAFYKTPEQTAAFMTDADRQIKAMAAGADGRVSEAELDGAFQRFMRNAAAGGQAKGQGPSENA